MSKGKGVWTACYLDLFECEKTLVASDLIANDLIGGRESAEFLWTFLPNIVPSLILRLNLHLLERSSEDGVFPVSKGQRFLSVVWPDYDAGVVGVKPSDAGYKILSALRKAGFLHQLENGDGLVTRWQLHEYEIHNARLLKDRARKRRGCSAETPRVQKTEDSKQKTGDSREKKKKKSPSPKPAKEPTPDGISLAQYLYDSICHHTPDFKADKKKLTGWALAFDVELRKGDGFTKEELEKVMYWAHISDPRGFWHANLLSATSVRKHAQSILIDARKGGSGKGLSVQDLLRMDDEELDRGFRG